MQTRRVWSYIAAAVLAVVTLSVFYVLQYYGPESAVRRFQRFGLAMENQFPPQQKFDARELTSGQLAELAAISTDAPDGPYNRYLIDNKLRPIALQKGRYDIARIDFQQSNQVTAAVVYRFPDGQTGAIVWIVTLKNGVWKVDASQTVKVDQELRGR